jgi:hypothetical protein
VASRRRARFRRHLAQTCRQPFGGYPSALHRARVAAATAKLCSPLDQTAAPFTLLQKRSAFVFSSGLPRVPLHTRAIAAAPPSVLPSRRNDAPKSVGNRCSPLAMAGTTGRLKARASPRPRGVVSCGYKQSALPRTSLCQGSGHKGAGHRRATSARSKEQRKITIFETRHPSPSSGEGQGVRVPLPSLPYVCETSHTVFSGRDNQKGKR